MVWGDHDNNFYTLYRKLQKEVIELDWTRSTAHTTGGKEMYQGSESSTTSESPYGYEGGTHTLKNQLPMREVILRATLNRLTKEEQEIEDGCGTGKKHEETIQNQTNNTIPLTKPKDSMDIDNSQNNQPTRSNTSTPVSTTPTPAPVSSPPVKTEPVVTETKAVSPPPTSSTNTPSTPNEQAVSCPICSKTFPSTVSNRELNKHIDECLAKMS
eukprot:CAMPEP_0168563574 /NCGR_PEP_ID=MMETSP0413-20121227/12751_1 /TAXON_ID=136452 /ORGANISM="Filamoeba nolandi, Strain NC-AS-23-1" /LENGTH=212 /DNA_ID=CAMNT_0008595121 /DNA_START=107 /DNA_END=745 /DNA_ORIENTATION=+